MTALVAVDTIVLIRAIREEEDPQDPKAVPRAKALIAQLRADRIPIILPAVALGEYLAGTPKGDVAEHNRIIEENFVIEPFDAISAFYVGEIWREHHNIMDAKSFGTGKQCLKADAMIFATALAKGAGVIYADDKWFHTIAKKYAPKIQAKHVPKMNDKQKLADFDA